jgi:hypothetical protein
MKLSPSKARALEFPIGEHTYSVPPAGIADGLAIARTLTDSAKSKLQVVDLFKLAVGDVWQQMEADRVPYTEAWRVGMACLAREKVLLTESGPDRWDLADDAARAVWESGIDPEALAAWVAANSGTAPTKPSTRTAAASTTRSRASGSGTNGRKPTPARKATPSRGNGSSWRGR